MMRCKYHSDYNPTSGEPLGQMDVTYLPCPYCWQAYARHLCNLMNEEDIEAFTYMDRIKNLEQKLESALLASENPT